MIRRFIVFVLFLSSFWVCCFPTVLQAENWPCWRGPRGDGTSRETNLPLHWDGKTGQGVLWKSPVPGVGHGSPIVWEDRLFLLSCLPERQERILLCYAVETGELLWQRTVIKCPLETKHALNSHASSTPATDGESVYCTFLQIDGRTEPATNVGKARDLTPGQIVVAAYDFQGRQQWLRQVGEFKSVHGFCSNPVIFEDLLIINGDHDGDSYILALDRKSGRTVWKTERRHKTRSYVTPIIREMAGKTQLIFSGSHCIVSLDPATGQRIWNIEGPTQQYVASMVDDGEMLFMAAGFPTHHVLAIRPDGSGDVTETHVAWHKTNVRCYVPSPVVVGNYLLVADDRGTANCFDTGTGKRYWQGRLGKHFSASLTTAGGLVYFLADDGVMKVVQPGPDLTVMAENPLGEDTYSSPAMANGRIYLRGEQSLYCIGP